MDFRTLIVFSLVICQVIAQSYDVVFFIDNFEATTPPITLKVPSTLQSVDGESYTQHISILGGERRMGLGIEKGQVNESMTTAVSNRTWTTNSELCSGYTALSYNGTKKGPPGEYTGLGCLDFTQGGKADGFIIELTANRVTTMLLLVNSNENENDKLQIEILPTIHDPQPYYLPFSSFGADFTCVNRISLVGEVDISSRFSVNKLAVGKSRPVPSAVVSPSLSPGQCASHADCNVESLEESCSTSLCRNNECIIVANLDVAGCCNVKTDCPYHECHIASCSDFVCKYGPLDNCATQSTRESSESPKVALITFGTLFGIGTVIVISVIIGAGIFVWWKKRSVDEDTMYGALEEL